MIQVFLTFFILAMLGGAFAQAQEVPPPAPELPPPAAVQYPAVRPRPPEDPNKESSSFIGDSENLDPLRARRENLKDDNEPVLEDIRQVLDAPAPPPTPEKSPEGFEASQPQAPAASKTSVKKIATKSKPAKKKVAVQKPKVKSKAKRTVVRNSDDPDQQVEKKFYQNYMRYNAEPTSTEQWSAATFGRSAEVYIVQKGDTLWTISETLFGDSLFWPKIWALNRQGITNPHYILPGMRVNFFPGSSEDVPTLAVGEFSPHPGSPEKSMKAEALSEEPGNPFMQPPPEVPADEMALYQTPDDSEDTPVNLEAFGGGIEANRKAGDVTRLNSKDRPTRLPPSIPLYRSELYFGQPRRIEMIDLEPPQKIPYVQTTDIFLTDRLVLSDLKIPRLSSISVGCNPGDLIEDVEFIRKTPTDEYTILQPLDKVILDNKKFLYPYKKVGTIKYYEDKLKIKDCNYYLSADQIFVPTSVLVSLKSKKLSQEAPKILGGPTVMDQSNFYQSQNVYVDMGSLNFDLGQVFGVKSTRIDEPAGHIKILDRFGSYALGVILEESNPIRSGDKIIPQ